MSAKVCDHNDWVRIYDSVNATLQCSNCTLKMTSAEYALFRALREQVAILRELVALQKAESETRWDTDPTPRPRVTLDELRHALDSKE